jgi:hypothetical protein
MEVRERERKRARETNPKWKKIILVWDSGWDQRK